MVFGFPSLMDEIPPEGHLRGVYGDHWPHAFRIARIIVLRTAASEAQNHRCCYCGVRTSLDGPVHDRPTLEHVIPRSRGGLDEPLNCVMACSLCNVSRRDAHIAEECFLDGGSCDEPTAVVRCGGGKGMRARRRRMRADMRTDGGWVMSDEEVALRHDVSVETVARYRAHRALILEVLAGQDRVCPACHRTIRDGGSMIAATVDGTRRFEVVHQRCYPAYRDWLVGQGRLHPPGGVATGDGDEGDDA